ncbi:MAG TPA: alpha/beta fold hydrolase [Chthoniobacterales bacterium]|nr:alpha/beta fold hydrolase [Chthoniobacterales bacterium]
MSLILLLVTIAAVLALTRAFWQHRVAKQIKITSGSGIDSLEKVRLGGVDQWILIRGWERDAPVLLLMHGGPGFPCMPFAHVAGELEKHFVVVHWDQRGAGKSYSPSIPNKSMNMKQFVADALELTDLLRARFKQPRILLGAHSWGSMIAALAVAQWPERFSAYFAISQAANPLESERIMYRWALKKAAAEGNKQAIAELTELGRPPYERFADYNRMVDWIGRFSGKEHQPVSRWHFVRLVLESPFYSWRDLLRIPLGARFSFSRLWREAFYEVDLLKQAPRLDVPVYFFLGRHDHTATASAAMAERYFEALDAAPGKQLIWFEQSGHWPQLEEPARFQAEFIRAAEEARRIR